MMAMIRKERSIEPVIAKIGMALALSFAGFLCSRLRILRIKPSPKSCPSGHGNEVNLGGDNIGAVLSTCNTVSEEETRPKQNGDKAEFLLPEFDELVKEVEFEATTVGNSFKKDIDAPRFKAGSYIECVDPYKDEYEQEIGHLRNMIRMLQDREQNLEVQLLEYCGLREQQTAVMELQNRLKISNMEVKMFNVKVKNLQSENQRLKEQVADNAKVLTELETAKARIELLNKKIRDEAELNREQIVTLKQKVARLQDQEYRDAACDQDTKIKLQKLKALDSEEEELRKSNLRLQIENSDLARSLASTKILANAVLEDPEANIVKQESERLRQENESLRKKIEQLQSDRCSDIEELVYMRWINACLRYELRNYQPPAGKTGAKDLSKSLSPTSEKKAKQLILEYADSNGPGSVVDLDLDQWSSSQASSITDSGECDDFSSAENSSAARINTTSQTKFFSKLRRLLQGKDSHHNNSQVSAGCLEDSYSPQPSTSTGIKSRASFDFSRLTSMKEEDSSRYSGSIVTGSSNKFSLSKKGSFSGSLGIERSDLEKYAEALKDSSVNAKQRRRRAVSYS